MARRHAALIPVLALFVARSGYAQTSPEPQLAALPCPDAVDASELTRLLRIELGTSGAASNTIIQLAPSPCSAQVREVAITLEHSVTKKRATRSVAVAELDSSARARTVALAIAELVRSRSNDLATPSAPPPSPPQAPPTAPTGAAPVPAGVLVHAAIAGAIFPSFNGALLGPNVGVSVPVGRSPLRLRAEGGAGFGATRAALGSIDSTLSWGTMGVAIANDGHTDTLVEVGPSLLLGNAVLHGQSSTQAVTTATGFVAALAFDGRAALRVVSSFWATIALSVGGVMQSVAADAEGQHATGIGGAMMSTTVGIGWTPER